MSKDRIVNLQGQVRIARLALEKIKSGCHDPEGVASEAVDAMWKLDPKQPLQGLVGHGDRRVR